MTSGLYGEDWWKANLCMSQNAFAIACNEVRPYIEKQVTCFRVPVSVEKRVAITLWKLATVTNIIRSIWIVYCWGNSHVKCGMAQMVLT